MYKFLWYSSFPTKFIAGPQNLATFVWIWADLINRVKEYKIYIKKRQTEVTIQVQHNPFHQIYLLQRQKKNYRFKVYKEP